MKIKSIDNQQNRRAVRQQPANYQQTNKQNLFQSV